MARHNYQMMKMEINTKETCADYAVKAAQGIVVAAVMPVIFTAGLMCAGAIGALAVGEMGAKTIKKIKNRVTGE